MYRPYCLLCLHLCRACPALGAQSPDRKQESMAAPSCHEGMQCRESPFSLSLRELHLFSVLQRNFGLRIHKCERFAGVTFIAVTQQRFRPQCSQVHADPQPQRMTVLSAFLSKRQAENHAQSQFGDREICCEGLSRLCYG